MARKRYTNGKRVDMRQGGRVALAKGRSPNRKENGRKRRPETVRVSDEGGPALTQEETRPALTQEEARPAPERERRRTPPAKEHLLLHLMMMFENRQLRLKILKQDNLLLKTCQQQQ